jgi:branched chain amino acid efflux pump
MTISSTPRSEFLNGMRDTIPMVVGGIPFGIIFGAVAASASPDRQSLSPAAVAAMSAFVFAGSAQFIGAGLYSQFVSIPFIIATTFVVNLRHALYSATLGPRVKHLSQKWLLPLGFWLTDETFVIVARRYEQTTDHTFTHWYWLGSAVFMYVDWSLWTWVGIFVGQSIPEPEKWGLDFAMIVTFTGMVVPMLKNKAVAVAALVAGTTSVLANGLPNKLGLMLAAIAGVVAGMVMEMIFKEDMPAKAIATGEEA